MRINGRTWYVFVKTISGPLFAMPVLCGGPAQDAERGQVDLSGPLIELLRR